MNANNIRADMLRQSGMPPNNSSMLPSFIQNPSPSGQQPLPQGHMGLPPAAANANAPMGMLANNPQNAARFLPMQQTGNIQPPPQQARMQMMRQPPGGQHMSSSAAQQLAGIGANQLFPQGNLQPPGPNLGPRRGPPQPQPLPGAAGHMTGLSPNNINLAINPQNQMQAHLRPGQQQNSQRMQQPMSGPEMAMVMARQGSNGNGHMARTASTLSALNSSSQIPQVTFPPGMQPSHPQNSLQNPAQISPNQLPISSPRPGSHPQTHNPSVAMAAQGPSQTPVSRTQMTPDNTMFSMGFPNSQFPPGPSASRMPNNGQFPFTSSNSPIQMPDVPSPMPSSLVNTTSSTIRAFQLTPAQQLEQMNGPQDSFNSPFNLQTTRPPSQHNLHSSVPQQQPPFQPPLHRQSPRPTDPHLTHPQRPASQPQQLMPVRPPSQSGPRTPSQTSVNINATGTGTRIPVTPGGQPPHPTGGAGPAGVPSRPAQQSIAPPSGPSGPVPSLPSNDGPSTNAIGIAPPQPNSIPQVGSGQGIQRLLQFSGILGNESQNKLHLSWWEECIKEYFTGSAIMKITLWKDNQRAEAKLFEIGVPILPRFFLVTTQSGVRSMSLALDGARERSIARNPHLCVIECPSAVWTYKYSNGYTVSLRGPLTAHIVMSQPTISTADSASAFHGGQRHLKFENLQFDADQHDKYILLDTVMQSRMPSSPRVRNEPATTINGITIQQQQQLDDERKWEEPRIMVERSLIPGEPVNAFGIPQATMRCLELAESVGQMSDLIVYSTENRLGPLEALKKYAAQIRESQNYGPFNSVLSSGNSNPPNTYTFVTNTPNGPSTINPGGTLYSSAPSSVTNPQANPSTVTSSINSPQNTPSSASNSPQKQPQTIPQQQQQSQGSSTSSTGPTASPTVSSGATTNTPHLSNSSLKRKQTDVASPTISNPDQPPTKRPQRKRGRTAGGG